MLQGVDAFVAFVERFYLLTRVALRRGRRRLGVDDERAPFARSRPPREERRRGKYANDAHGDENVRFDTSQGIIICALDFDVAVARRRGGNCPLRVGVREWSVGDAKKQFIRRHDVAGRRRA